MRIESFETRVRRHGVVLEPNGDPTEIEGVLNPGSIRSREGRLLLYPRTVGKGNTSRIGIVEVSGPRSAPSFVRAGFALEPFASYEFRDVPGGYGCEDPRVTFIPLLDAFVMAYAAYGPAGPRIGFALSDDGYVWRRLGLADFSAPGLPCGDDKDAAFFPEPVLSPKGVPSFAFYHRPMLHTSVLDGRAAIPTTLDKSRRGRESTRIAYVPLDPVLEHRENLLKVTESVVVLEPAHDWGCIKNGAGTPPTRVEEGWLSLFHGVDVRYDAEGRSCGMRYSAGIIVHDLERPDLVRYRSPRPILVPETEGERHGAVNNVVFPTAIDGCENARDYDVYYGMADARIGRLRLELGASTVALSEEESAA